LQVFPDSGTIGLGDALHFAIWLEPVVFVCGIDVGDNFLLLRFCRFGSLEECRQLFYEYQIKINRMI
jgi:hypothetical protein